MKSPNKLMLLLAASLLLGSCAKDSKTDPTQSDEPPVNITPSWGFTWNPAGKPAVVADSAFFVPSFHNIIAYKGGNTNKIDIGLSALTVGAYTVNSATGNSLDYTYSGGTYSCTSGTVTISANSGTKLSGSFNANMTGSISSVSGVFTDLPQR